MFALTLVILLLLLIDLRSPSTTYDSLAIPSFLTLPAEIRNMIYGLLIGDIGFEVSRPNIPRWLATDQTTSPWKTKLHRHPGERVKDPYFLARVCQQTYSDTITLPLAFSSFIHFADISDFVHFLHTVDDNQLGVIRFLRIGSENLEWLGYWSRVDIPLWSRLKKLQEVRIVSKSVDDNVREDLELDVQNTFREPGSHIKIIFPSK